MMSRQLRGAEESPVPVRRPRRGIQRGEFRGTRLLHSARSAVHLGPAFHPAVRRTQGCKLHCRALDDPIPTAAAGQMKAGTSGAQSHGLTRVGPDSGGVPPDLSVMLGLWIAAANPAFRLPRRIWGACNFVIRTFVIC